MSHVKAKGEKSEGEFSAAYLEGLKLWGLVRCVRVKV